MRIVEALQRLGLTKYEAEAYFTLLREGPLTGYEVGKRSGVPLSRSYEVLERMTQKGLALLQPGEPPRYLAQDPAHLVAQMRSDLAGALDELAGALAEVEKPVAGEEFWVLRNRRTILDRARAMVHGAVKDVAVALPAPRYLEPGALRELTEARAVRVEVKSAETERMILVLVDGREALVGTISPAEACQAVVSENVALLEVAQSYMAGQAPSSRETQREDWVAWQDEKHRRLLRMPPRPEVA